MDQFSLDLFAPEPAPVAVPAPRRRTFTVKELNAEIRSTLTGAFDNIYVAGEISGVKLQPSAHCYFTLKDSGAQIRCVCFKSSYRYLKCKPRDGLAVLVRGRLDVFEARGEYQLLVESIEPQGLGTLQLAFEQLKQRLLEEGLFEASRKQALPRFPWRIGIVTSPRGAVISDMLQILARRFPGLHIRLYPALVQGETAAEEVCRGIAYFDRGGWADLVILARGGGSLEDLWTFNTEPVARAIAACRVPLVSAIGHETDVTMADFVADLRAPTPSAAAELVICTRQELFEALSGLEHRARQFLRYRLAMLHRRLDQQGVARAAMLLQRSLNRWSQRVDDQDYRLRHSLRASTELRRKNLDRLTARLKEHDPRPRLERQRALHARSERALAEHITRRLLSARLRLDPVTAKLTQLSPLRILDRGYAIVTHADGTLIKTTTQVGHGAPIQVRLPDGTFPATAD